MAETNPEQVHTVTRGELEELDALYTAREDSGRPNRWGQLVAELRAVRRMVEAGVAVQIEDGPELRTWSEFYSWAHARYHMLEDGYDAWIGDDRGR